MNIKCFLENVCNEIKYQPIRKNISDEIELHMQEIKDDYIDEGMNEIEAEEEAVKQMGDARQIGKELNKVHKAKLDLKLLSLIGILIIFGIIIEILKRGNIIHINNIIYIIICLCISIGIYFCNYIKIKKHSLFIYLIATVIICLYISGSLTIIESALQMNSFEVINLICTIAIPMYIVSFAGFIQEYNRKDNLILKIYNKKIRIKKKLIKMILFSITSLVLILKISSFTNTIILGIIYLVITTDAIIHNSKNKKTAIIKLYGVVLMSMIIILFYLLVNPYVINRLVSSFNPEKDPQVTGYIGMLQKEVMENAKNFGQTNTEIILNNEFIINNSDNYAFIYLIGKTGKISSLVLFLTIILTSVKLIINAKKIKEQYGKFLTIGIGMLYILQSIMNLLMNINLGIKVDVNLPFVTFGGIDFIVNIVCIAIVLSVYRKKDIILYEGKGGERNAT